MSDFTLNTYTLNELSEEVERAQRKKKLQELAARPLAGHAGDTTADLFNGGDTPLFNHRWSEKGGKQ